MFGCLLFLKRYRISTSLKRRNSFSIATLQMCEANLISHHKTSVGSVNGHKKSMEASSSSSLAIQCVSGHSILTLTLSNRSFQTPSICSSVELSWSPVGSDFISIKITWLLWKRLICQLSHLRPILKPSVTACLHMADLLSAWNACLCSLRVPPIS